MKTQKLKCGCQHTVGEVERWVLMCPEHQAEVDLIHTRWAVEHREQQRRQEQEARV